LVGKSEWIGILEDILPVVERIILKEYISGRGWGEVSTSGFFYVQRAVAGFLLAW